MSDTPDIELTPTTNGTFTKKPMGRPKIELTSKIINTICNYLKLGCYLETSVTMSGVSKETFYKWIRKGHKQKSGIYKDLLDSVERASEESGVRDLQQIDRAIMGQQAVYMRHEPGTKIPLRDDRGKPQFYPEGHPSAYEPIMIDASGQIMMDERGKPIVLTSSIAPSWQAAVWRLSKRKPQQWGDQLPEYEEGDKVDEMESHNIEIEFVE